ncbi:MAG: hypothetical protein ACRCYR_17745 [Phycicoccus sp.]
MARGDATSDSDIDLLVDLLPGGGNELLGVRPRRGTERAPRNQGRCGGDITTPRRGVHERAC